MTGAIKTRVEDPPTQGNVPPDNEDPMHPDQYDYVPPPDDDMLSGEEPDDPLDDNHQPDYNTGPDPDDDDDQEYIIPDDYGPPPGDDLDMPGIQDLGETQDPSIPSTPFFRSWCPNRRDCWSWTRWRSFTRTWSNFWTN